MVEHMMPYRQATYEIAKEADKEAEYKGVLYELSLIWEKEPSFVLALSHPKISKAEKQKWLMELFEDSLPPVMMKTLLIFNEHGVIQALPDIYKAYVQCFEKDHDIENVLVETACPLDEKQQTSLQKMLEQKLHKTISLTYKIDPELIAGLRVRAGDLVLDNTVLSRLEAIKEKIRN